MRRDTGQASLFPQTVAPRVSSSGPDVRFVPDFLSAGDANNLFALLEAMPGWQQDKIRVFGKIHPLPRLHRWFATSNERYRWSGIEMRPEPFPSALTNILQRLEDESGTRFNTALGNFYRSGKDAVSWHSDDEPDLDRKSVV